MGWSIGYDDDWKRDIGYGVPAYCDSPKCNEEIDRGLAFVCGGGPYGENDTRSGCGLYFCSEHLFMTIHGQMCNRCFSYKPPYKKIKPEHPEWLAFKATDPSWEKWRKEQAVESLRGENNE